MSGGSWDYSYGGLKDLSVKLLLESDPKRKALGRLVEKVANAMHDIEWVDSGDYGPGNEIAAIDIALGKDRDKLVLAEMLVQAVKIRDELNVILEKCNDFESRK